MDRTKHNNCQSCKYGNTVFEKGMEAKNINFSEFHLLNENDESVLGNMYGRCEQGHDDIYLKWWKDNGNKVGDEPRDKVECFESHDSVKPLDNMLDLLEEINSLLDKGNKNT